MNIAIMTIRMIITTAVGPMMMYSRFKLFEVGASTPTVTEGESISACKKRQEINLLQYKQGSF